ncbi:uncharacterized protein LOC122050737 [Zingiber officinale]|uniref:Transmembrane protein n=1 Tax=Zingiber officinale TaxID=94328 RepID=A0A8J5HHK8_ZINOF|nr:uncharacterized protein LOC122050737 [Zingiber officinale]KAG6522158.1 hypothetical protein ZIOFF_019295 [Zingiber officinale]
MECRKCYLDLVLIPLSLLLHISYHIWLWYQVRYHPLRTAIGIHSAARRFWVLSVVKENEKKNILAVQTFRNTIMGATLMASTCAVLCSGLAALVTTVERSPLAPSTTLQYVSVLLAFLFAFLCFSLSVKLINQVCFLINTPTMDSEFTCDVLEKAYMFQLLGSRVFYAALTLLLWIFGSVFVFSASVAVVCLLLSLDVVHEGRRRRKDGSEVGGDQMKVDDEKGTVV